MFKFELTASIVLYNNERNVLSSAINSFLSISLPARLYLIDNSPSDTLRDITADSRCVYLHNPSNPGFGAGHNIAIRMALAEQSPYHLVLNPDIYFDKGVLEQIHKYMNAHPQVGNIMPKVLYPDGSIQYLCKLLPTPYDWIGRRFNPIKSLVNKRNELFELRFTGYDKVLEAPYLSGCFMFLRTESLEVTGLFDEGIFMYGEEADLCRRLINNGFKTVYFPEVSIVHHFEKGSHKSFHLTLVGMRSAIYYFNKWGWLFDKQRREINKNTLKKLGKIS